MYKLCTVSQKHGIKLYFGPTLTDLHNSFAVGLGLALAANSLQQNYIKIPILPITNCHIPCVRLAPIVVKKSS